MSATDLPAMNASADSRAWAMLSCPSPSARNFTCCQRNRRRSLVEKYLRAASPLAKWKIEAPMTTVLSTSKNAAACGLAGMASGCSTSRTADPAERPGTSAPFDAAVRLAPSVASAVSAQCRQGVLELQGRCGESSGRDQGKEMLG